MFRYRKTRKPGIIVPLLPLTFIVCYLGDMAYGTKMQRIRGEMLHITCSFSSECCTLIHHVKAHTEQTLNWTRCLLEKDSFTSAQKITETIESLNVSYLLNVFILKSYVDELKWCWGAASSRTIIECAVGEWRQRLSLVFMLHEDILSTCCITDGVMWHVWLFER